jgi:hypothetical protein
MGLECSGYQYVEDKSTATRRRKPRTKPAPLHTFVQQGVATGTDEVSSQDDFTTIDPTKSKLSGSWGYFVPDISTTSPKSTQLDSVKLGTESSSVGHILSNPGPLIGLPLDLVQAFGREHIARPVLEQTASNSGTTRPYDHGSDGSGLIAHTNTFPSEPSQTTFLTVTKSDGYPVDRIQRPSNRIKSQPMPDHASARRKESLGDIDPGEECDESHEELMQLGVTLALDSSVPDNFIPFALQNCECPTIQMCRFHQLSV